MKNQGDKKDSAPWGKPPSARVLLCAEMREGSPPVPVRSLWPADLHPSLQLLVQPMRWRRWPGTQQADVGKSLVFISSCVSFIITFALVGQVSGVVAAVARVAAVL